MQITLVFRDRHGTRPLLKLGTRPPSSIHLGALIQLPIPCLRPHCPVIGQYHPLSSISFVLQLRSYPDRASILPDRAQLLFEPCRQISCKRNAIVGDVNVSTHGAHAHQANSPSSPPTACRARPGPTHIFGSQLLPYVALMEKANKTFPQMPVLGSWYSIVLSDALDRGAVKGNGRCNRSARPTFRAFHCAHLCWPSPSLRPVLRVQRPPTSHFLPGSAHSCAS